MNVKLILGRTQILSVEDADRAGSSR